MNKINFKKMLILIFVFASFYFLACSITPEYKNIGDVITLENCEITIDKVELLDSIEYVTPQDGNVFIAIKFNYKNIGDETLEYKSLPIIDIQTSEGTSYTINYDASNVYALIEQVDYSIMTTALEADAVRDDAEVYEVSQEDVTNKEIVIKIDDTNNYIKLEDLAQSSEETQQNQ
jgi:hypothetical protein